jgi:integrase/recombinase XerC
MQSEAYRNHIGWLRLRGLSDQTILKRSGNLRQLSAWAGGRPLLDLTETDLMEWAASIGALSNATRAVYISHIRSFYAWCYANKYLPADPAVSLPHPRVPKRTPRPISEDLLAHAVSIADGRIRTWLVLAGWAGLRAKEIALLRAENIHLSDNPPYLLVTAEATKGNRERVVALPEFVVTELRRCGLHTRGLCWRKADGTPLEPNTVSWMACRYLHELGIEHTLHSLRHRFGTQIQRASGDIRVTQELLGHSSPATTAGYAQVADIDKHRAVAQLPSPVRTGWAAAELCGGVTIP